MGQLNQLIQEVEEYDWRFGGLIKHTALYLEGLFDSVFSKYTDQIGIEYYLGSNSQMVGYNPGFSVSFPDEHNEGVKPIEGDNFLAFPMYRPDTIGNTQKDESLIGVLYF